MSISWKTIRRVTGLAAIAYVGSRLTLPGTNVEWLTCCLHEYASPLVKLMDSLTGGAVGRGSWFALGFTPYLTAKLYFWLAKRVFPKVAALHEDADGREKLTAWTRALTVVLALIQSIGYAKFLESIPNVVAEPGVAFVAQTTGIIAVTSVAVMWLSERLWKSDEVENSESFSVSPDTREQTLVSTSPAEPRALSAPNVNEEALLKRIIEEVRTEKV